MKVEIKPQGHLIHVCLSGASAPQSAHVRHAVSHLTAQTSVAIALDLSG